MNPYRDRLLAVLLITSLAFGSLSCSASAKRITGTVLGLSGLSLAVAGVVVVAKQCEGEELNDPTTNCFDVGPPEVGWSILGAGLLLAAVGAYIMFFLTPTEEEEPEPVVDWSETVKLPQDEDAADIESPSGVKKIIDAAIAARGGREKLEALGAVRADFKGSILRWDYQGTLVRTLDHTRYDFDHPEVVAEVRGIEHCWRKIGQAVAPCVPDKQVLFMGFQALHRATFLTMLDQPEYELKAAREDWEGRACDVLEIIDKKTQIGGWIYFDAETHLPAGVKMEVGGPKGKTHVIGRYSDPVDACGVKLFSKQSFWIFGKPLISEELSNFRCEAADPKLFEPPEQVAHGTFEEKQIPDRTVICTMIGDFKSETIGAAIGALVKFKSERDLGTLGPFYMEFLEKNKTEACFPVNRPAPEKPVTEGEIVMKGVPSHRVLTVYYTGKFEGSATDALLKAELKKRNLKAAGPTRNVGYCDDIPLEQNVGELMIPIQ